MGTRKGALVTGGSSGIGRGIAMALAREGWEVAVTYSTNKQGALETQRMVHAAGGVCHVLQAHMQHPETPEQLVSAAVQCLPGLDLLVNNAGRDTRNSILNATYEDLRYIVETNFYGYCLLAGAVARYMVRQGTQGSIIFVTSTRAHSPHPDDFLYGGIKAAIERASQSMALELSRYGIRVNCLAPGATRVREAFPPRVPAGTEVEGKPFYPLEPAIPLGRLGTIEDNGAAVAFLASEKASYITGVSLRLDGGLSLPGQPEWFAPSCWLDEAWQAEQEQKMLENDT